MAGTEEEKQGPATLDDPFCDPNNPKTISFNNVATAAFNIKHGVVRTPCTKSPHLSTLTGMEIYLKKEFMQATGSFKDRGARNTFLQLSKEQRKKGIIAASSGNFAQACCYHGYDLGIPVTVIMPIIAPVMKIQKCISYHGNVILKGNHYDESKAYAYEYGREHGLLFINGYDHPHIMAGQGTIGLEMWEDVPDLEAIICPVGGGGIIGGVVPTMMALNKDCKIIGVEPERASCLTAALKAGTPVTVQVTSTLADGLAVARIGGNVFETVKDHLDRIITIKEDVIAISILRLLECEKAIVEGAGAAALAGILSGQLDDLKGKKVGLIVSGGNIDTTVLNRAIERGLVSDGRMVKFKVIVPDSSKSIQDLCKLITRTGACIKDIYHERAWISTDVFSVEVKVICETRNYEHGLALRDILFQENHLISFNNINYLDEVLHEE